MPAASDQPPESDDREKVAEDDARKNADDQCSRFQNRLGCSVKGVNQ